MSQENSQHQDTDNDDQGVGEETSWHSLQQHHLHPHYSVSILDETINRPYTFQAAINRVIAGRALFVLFSDWLISRVKFIRENSLSFCLFPFTVLLSHSSNPCCLISCAMFILPLLLYLLASFHYFLLIEKRNCFKGAIQIKKLCIYLCSVCVCTCMPAEH